MNASFFYGTFHLYGLASRIIRGFWRNFVRPLFQANDRNYLKYGLPSDNKTSAKFNRKSYAVVTGGSDGLGLAFCKKLADEGFNIMIVARDEQKMKEKCAELKKTSTNKKLQANYTVANFSELRTIQDYKTKVADKLKHLDVAMLILNAGVYISGPFKDTTDDQVETIVNVNACHVTYLLKAMLPQLTSRP